MIQDSSELLAVAAEAEVIGIDEVQFLDAGVVEICERLANAGKRVIIAGLDQDYRARPFEPVPQLLAMAEYITKTLAICVRCGNPANRTQRVGSAAGRIAVGSSELYEARCRRCFEPPEEESGGPSKEGEVSDG
jgi:thymidine kinase